MSSSAAGPCALVVDATSAYFTNCQNPGVLQKIALDGGSVTTLASGLLKPSFVLTSSIAVDASSVYCTSEHGITRSSLDGATVSTLAASDYALAIAVDATSIYWSTITGSITKIAK